MLCERCHAGQMEEYQRKLGEGDRQTWIKGSVCSRCGYVELENDEDVWSVVGL